jgi:hypothetical protein
MAAVKTAGDSLISVHLIEVIGEDEAYQYAAELQKLNNAATHADATAVALKMRIINQLRAEGLDGNNTGIRGMFTGGDAASTARKVVQPLVAIGADMENAARNAHVFRNRLQALVFDPIRMARESKNRGVSGLTVR